MNVRQEGMMMTGTARGVTHVEEAVPHRVSEAVILPARAVTTKNRYEASW